MKTLDDIERHAFADGDTKTVALVQQMQDVIEVETDGESAEEAYDRGRTDGRAAGFHEDDYAELERKYAKPHKLLLALRADLRPGGAFDRAGWLKRTGETL